MSGIWLIHSHHCCTSTSSLQWYMKKEWKPSRFYCTAIDMMTLSNKLSLICLFNSCTCVKIWLDWSTIEKHSEFLCWGWWLKSKTFKNTIFIELLVKRFVLFGMNGVSAIWCAVCFNFSQLFLMSTVCYAESCVILMISPIICGLICTSPVVWFLSKATHIGHKKVSNMKIIFVESYVCIFLF